MSTLAVHHTVTGPANECCHTYKSSPCKPAAPSSERRALLNAYRAMLGGYRAVLNGAIDTQGWPWSSHTSHAGHTHTATHRSTPQHTTTHCKTLQHSATHCNTPQHTATHCNTLQHASTLCSTVLAAPASRAPSCVLSHSRLDTHSAKKQWTWTLAGGGSRRPLLLKMRLQQQILLQLMCVVLVCVGAWASPGVHEADAILVGEAELRSFLKVL